MNIARPSTAGAFASALFLLCGCGTTEISSHWKESDVRIDGKNAAWLASATAFDDKRVSGAVFNDSEFVYVGLRTTNRDLQRLLTRMGLIWWFDRTGAPKKSFGIHYPLPDPADRTSGQGEDGEGFFPGRDREKLLNIPAELELFSGPEIRERMSILAAGGIEPRIYRLQDTLVYELRVPLAPGALHPFGIGVTPGTVINLGVVTSTFQPKDDLPIERAGSDADPEGTFGGRRSGGARGMGGPRPDFGGRAGQLNAWMTVHLAAGR